MPGMTKIDGVVEALRERLEGIEKALSILEGGNRRLANGRRPRVGRVAGNGRRNRRGRRLSAAVRRKISLAAKARWAVAKKAGKRSL